MRKTRPKIPSARSSVNAPNTTTETVYPQTEEKIEHIEIIENVPSARASQEGANTTTETVHPNGLVEDVGDVAKPEDKAGDDTTTGATGEGEAAV